MNLKEKYFAIEDKYYDFLDKLWNKNIPIYKIIDPIEEKGIPTLPLTTLVLLLTIAILGHAFLMPGAAPTQEERIPVTIQTQNQQKQSISEVQVAALYQNQEIASGTTQNGTTQLQLLKGKTIKITAKSTDCNQTTKQIIIAAKTTIILQLQCKTTGKPQAGKCIQIIEGLEHTLLTSPAGSMEPQNCQLTIKKPNGEPKDTNWKIQQENTLILDPNECLTQNHTIQIDCQHHQYHSNPKPLIQEAQTYGEIELNPIDPEAEADADLDNVADSLDPDTQAEGPIVDDNQNNIPDVEEQTSKNNHDNTYAIHIKTKNKTNKPINLITIQATNQKGEPIQPAYDNEIYTDPTENGTAKLEIKQGTKFYLKAIDPQNRYRTALTSTSYTSTPQKIVSITMEKGFPTTTTIQKQKNNQAIDYATLRLKANNKLRQKTTTNHQGKHTFNLKKNGEYTLEITHDNYVPKKVSLTGAQDQTIQLKKLNQNNSGNLEIQTVNAKGIEEPFPQVETKTINLEGITTKTCTTNRQGTCTLKKLLQGNYTLKTRAPGKNNWQTHTQTTIKPGETTYRTLKAIPLAVTLTIRTKVNNYPQENVEVTLFDTTYGQPEKLAKKDSGSTRKVRFNTYKNKKLFLRTEYQSEKGYYGPQITNVFTIQQDTTKTINLKQVKQDIHLKTPKQATSGHTFDTQLKIDLPYQNNKTKQTYRKAEVEVWTGTPGTKINPFATPVLLNPINTYQFKLQPTPQVTTLTYNTYHYNNPSEGKEPSTASKYIKLTITNYEEPQTYSINLPMFARHGTNTNTTIHYRATWETQNGEEIYSHTQNFAQKNITITQGQKWIQTKNPEFHKYRAGFTTQKNTENTTWQQSLSTTQGSIFYLQLQALPRYEMNQYSIPLDTYPPMQGQKPIKTLSYNGKIQKIKGTTQIYETKAETELPTELTISEGSPTPQLKPGNILHTTIQLQAQNPTTTAELQILEDQANTLNYQITKTPKQQQTTIPNIIGHTQTKVKQCRNKKCEWTTPKQPIPTSSLTGEPKEVEIKTVFNNTGDQTQKFNINIQPNGLKETSENTENMTLQPQQQKEFTLTGEGNTLNKKQINIQLNSQTWKTIEHTAATYRMNTYPNPITEHDQEITATINKETHDNTYSITEIKTENRDQEIEITGIINKWLTQDIAENPEQFTKTGLDLETGQITLRAQSRRFGTINKTIKIQGTAITPEKTDHSTTFTTTPEQKSTTYATIHNYWQQPITLTLDEVHQHLETPEGQPAQKQPEDIYQTKHKMQAINADGSTISCGGECDVEENDNIDIPVNGKANVILETKPVFPDEGTPECNNYAQHTRITLETEPEQAGSKKTKTYNFKHNCNYGKTTPGFETLGTTYVTKRETGTEDQITPHSCSALPGQATLCDAEQTSLTLLKKVEQFKNTPKTSTTLTLATANEKITPNTLTKTSNYYGLGTTTTRKKQASQGNLALPTDLTCGVNRITLEKPASAPGIINATVRNRPKVWCDSSQNRFVTGLLNKDEGLKDRYQSTLTLQTTGFQGFDKFREAARTHLLNYLTGGEGLPPSGRNQITFGVKELSGSDLEQGIKDKITDYYKNKNEPIPSLTAYYNQQGTFRGGGKDIQIRIVYKQGTDQGTREKMTSCFVNNLLSLWINGNSPKGIEPSTYVYDLTTCDSVETTFKTPEITGLTFLNEQPKPKGIESARTGETVHPAFDTNANLEECIINAADKGEPISISTDKLLELGKENLELKQENPKDKLVYEDGIEWETTKEKQKRTVEIRCRNQQWLWTPINKMNIFIDGKAPKIDIPSEPGLLIYDEGLATPGGDPPAKFIVKATDHYMEEGGCKVTQAEIGTIQIEEEHIEEEEYYPTSGGSPDCSVSSTPSATEEETEYECTFPSIEVAGLEQAKITVTCTDKHGNENTKTKSATYATSDKMSSYILEEDSVHYPSEIIGKQLTGTGDKDKLPNELFRWKGNTIYSNSEELTLGIRLNMPNEYAGCKIKKKR